MRVRAQMGRLLDGILSDLRGCLEELDSDTMTQEQAARICGLGAQIEQAGATIKLIASRRIETADFWRRSGHRSAASWLAEKSGSSLGAAHSVIETARRLGDLGSTEDAIRAGELSVHEATEVVSAAHRDRGAERELLKLAKTHQMKKLQERARRIRSAATSKESDAARRLRVHRRRYFRHREDEDGGVRIDVLLPGDTAARLVAAVETEAVTGFEEARRTGEHESPDAYKADALVRLATGCARSRRGGNDKRFDKDTVVLHVDATALRRGYRTRDETCEIAGVGTVSVSTARRMIGDSFLKILVKDSKDVLSVCHVGRTINTHVQSALEARDRSCVVPGCHVARGLEIHHWKAPFAECGTSNLDGLARVCSFHHDLISYKGFELGGGPGHWGLRGPEETSSCEDDTCRGSDSRHQTKQVERQALF